MLIKFFKNGQGGGAAPVNYLIEREVVAYDDNRNALRDSQGKVLMFERKPLPEVLHGDPNQMRHLIDACEHQWSYRAGVIAFTGEDAPSDDQQREVMKQFDDLAFAGLEPDQTSILWVRHTHEDRVELHFVTPRMELTTGKSLNIAPPNYQKSYDALRDVLNKEHQWNDPQAPERAREVKSIIEDVERGDGREQLHDWVLDRIEEGSITNRTSMVEALTEAGFDIPRQSKAYITVRDPESDERWRLKGDIFREDWTRESAAVRAVERTSTNSNRESNREPSQSGSRLDALELGRLRERLQEVTQKRADYNRERYPIPSRNERTTGKEYAPNISDGHTIQPDRHSNQLHSELVLGNQYDRDIATNEPLTTGLGHEPDQQQHSPTHLGREAPATDQLSIWQVTASLFGNTQKEVTHGQEKRTEHRVERREGQSNNDHAKVERSFTNSTRTRIDQLRRTINASLQGIDRAVQSLGDKIDRDDQRQAGENRSFNGHISRITSLIGIGINHLRSKLGYERGTSASTDRERQGSTSSFEADARATATTTNLSRSTPATSKVRDQSLEPALAVIQKQTTERSR